MNKAWFFGCSFTSGVGYNFDEYLDPESDSYKGDIDLNDDKLWNSAPYLSWCKGWKTVHQYDIWPYLVSKSLNLQCINKGEGGSSNLRILHKVTRNLKNFRKGDFVFLGFTHPTRILTPTNSNYPKISTLLLEPLDKRSPARGIDDTRLLGGHTNLTIKQQYVLIDYLYYIVHEYSDEIEQYDYTTFKSLVEFLISIGVKPFLWDYSCWSYYENIATYTKGKVDDGHWSINGHIEFTNTVLEAIDNGITILPTKIMKTKYFKLKKTVI